MIINSTPTNEAVLSNVGQIGEFKIRNSAKAFSILSSGLYANKIRAIIRELSCNAVDSHVAAGKVDTPFGVHLPNALDPWFSIRDFGTGLNNDQIINIYTTYFESTKTGSNDFIGALGLGSKSPFSYTDNFTVTAVKDGTKRIYTAFINEMGVPSIALMTESDTDEQNGVEVKFAVNDRYDFPKFQQEAADVYTHFKLRPVIAGAHGFRFIDREYSDVNIVPGVSSYKNTGYYNMSSVALMGNIAYPINVPNAEQNLGDLAGLLNCGLEIQFNIGDLDFQASREGLSYIPQTIAAIKKKLEELNAQLSIRLAADADAIQNKWDRALFLLSKKDVQLWSASVSKYLTDTQFSLVTRDNYGIRAKVFKLSANMLANDFNIAMNGFDKNRGYNSTVHIIRAGPVHEKRADGTGYDIVDNEWTITVSKDQYFIENDLKIGAIERAKYNWRTARNSQNSYTDYVYILSKADKAKDMDVAGFLKLLEMPPENQAMLASSLTEKPKIAKASGKNVTILRLEEKTTGWGRKTGDSVWKDAGKASTFDSSVTYYYLPLSGYSFTPSIATGIDSPGAFYHTLSFSSIPSLHNIKVYGVRKTDIEFIKTQKNWINLEEHVVSVLNKLDDTFIVSVARHEVDKYSFIKYNNVVSQVDKNSPFSTLVKKFSGIKKSDTSLASLKNLTTRYAIDVGVKAEKVIKEFANECGAVRNRYPLLDCLRDYNVPDSALAEYINLIDAKKEGI